MDRISGLSGYPAGYPAFFDLRYPVGYPVQDPADNLIGYLGNSEIKNNLKIVVKP